MGKIVTQHGKLISILAHTGTQKRIQLQIGEGLSARFIDLDPREAKKLADALQHHAEKLLEEKPRKAKTR
ncbi:MAG: hypothetical protein NZ578_17205 [Candidatus Binatia bacterium]|nr:hypothetical protein [Candidatus Binatia bacterium]